MRRPAYPIVSVVLPAVLVVALGSGAAVAQEAPEGEASTDSALVAARGRSPVRAICGSGARRGARWTPETPPTTRAGLMSRGG